MTDLLVQSIGKAGAVPDLGPLVSPRSSTVAQWLGAPTRFEAAVFATNGTHEPLAGALPNASAASPTFPVLLARAHSTTPRAGVRGRVGVAKSESRHLLARCWSWALHVMFRTPYAPACTTRRGPASLAGPAASDYQIVCPQCSAEVAPLPRPVPRDAARARLGLFWCPQCQAGVRREALRWVPRGEATAWASEPGRETLHPHAPPWPAREGWAGQRGVAAEATRSVGEGPWGGPSSGERG